jgi:TolB protein
MTRLGFLLVISVFFGKTIIAQISASEIVLKEEGKENAYPRLSKDRSEFLYQSNRRGVWQLFIYDMLSQTSRQVTAGTSNNNFPDWSIDNEWIAFVSDRDGNEEIYLMKRNGSGLKRLTNDPARDIHPYFSPDKKFILFNSTRGNGSLDIYRFEISTGKTERLTDTKEDETCARYSPDMKQIVYLKNSYEIDDVFVLDLTTGLSANVTNTPSVTDGWPVYSPDGKWIYYSSMETGSYCIYKIKSDGSEKKQLSFAGAGEVHARLSISQDGKTILYNSQTGKTISVHRAELKN